MGFFLSAGQERSEQSRQVVRRPGYLLLTVALSIIPVANAFGQENTLRGTVDDPLLRERQGVLSASPFKKRPALKRAERLVPAVPEARPVDASDGTLAVSDPAQEVVGDDPAQQASSVAAPNTDDFGQDNEANASQADAGQSVDPAASSRAQSNATGSVLVGEVPDPFVRENSAGASERDELDGDDSDNERVSALEGREREAEADPFAAPGIRSGAFIFRPTLQAGIRYQTNPNNPSDDSLAAVPESRLLLRAESDWLRHALNFELETQLRKGFPGGASTENGIRAALDGRFDASVDDRVNVALSFERAREQLDTSSNTFFTRRPIVNTLRGSLGYEHDAGLLGMGGTLQVERQSFDQGNSLAGVAVPQNDRDFTNVTGTVRASYEASPVFMPFVEAELGRRIFDNERDALGIANSSTRYALRVGTAVDFGEKLNGELAAGWFVENIDDASLANISGFDLRGTMNWSPVRETNVALTLGTNVDGARSIGSSTSVAYNARAEFTRRLRANLEANALASLTFRDFQGGQESQTTLGAGIGATWWFNRYAGVNGSVQYNRTLEAGATPARSSTNAYLGVILRR